MKKYIMHQSLLAKTTLILLVLLSVGGVFARGINAFSLMMPEDVGQVVETVGRAPSRHFNNASLHGRYASLSTTITPGEDKTTYDACVGLVAFDGDGNFTDSETHSFNGEIVRKQYRGTYQINADGIGTMTYFDENGPTQPCPIVLSDGGKEVTFLVNVPGVVATGTLKKQ